MVLLFRRAYSTADSRLNSWLHTKSQSAHLYKIWAYETEAYVHIDIYNGQQQQQQKYRKNINTQLFSFMYIYIWIHNQHRLLLYNVYTGSDTIIEERLFQHVLLDIKIGNDLRHTHDMVLFFRFYTLWYVFGFIHVAIEYNVWFPHEIECVHIGVYHTMFLLH